MRRRASLCRHGLGIHNYRCVLPKHHPGLHRGFGYDEWGPYGEREWDDARRINRYTNRPVQHYGGGLRVATDHARPVEES